MLSIESVIPKFVRPNALCAERLKQQSSPRILLCPLSLQSILIMTSVKKTAIFNVRVFTGAGITAPQTVVIDGDVIGNSPDGADETIDAKGWFLLPGFIDAHVHIHHEGHLLDLARYGVTTALDMAMWPAEKMNSLRSKHGLPSIQSAGLPVTSPGSLHSHFLPLPEEALLRGPEEAEKFVQARIDEALGLH